MKYLPIIITALLLLAACSTEVKEEPKLAEQLKEQITTETPKPETVQEPPKLTPPEPVKEETTSPAQTRTKMYRFLDEFAKVTGYEFKYRTNKYYSKGTAYKVQLSTPVIIKGAKFGDLTKNLFYYDTVYVNRATKTAIAYCEGHDSTVNRQCANLDLYDLAYPVEFTEYDEVLPEDWLFAYLDKEPKQLEENKYYIKGRATVYVKFEGDPEIELNIEPGTGLILRADKKKGNTLVERNDYEDLVANKVRDVDIRHRSRSEIPTEETFFR